MLIKFCGIAGTIIFLFGFITALLVGDFSSDHWPNPILMGHMIFGLIVLLIWLFGYGVSNVGSAGEALKGRGARYGVNAVLYSLVFVGFVIVINWFVYRYDQRWDLTENRVFSLSSQSAEILQGLKKPLKLVAFKGVTLVDEITLKDLLALYKSGAPTLIDTKLVDVRAKPYSIEQYEIKQGNVIYLEYGEGDKKAVSRINEASEQAVTNAIVKLVRGESKKIYYVEGHDEPDLTSEEPNGTKNLADAIGDEHLIVESIFLAQKGSIPDDAAAVILCSPKQALRAEEKEALIKYVDQGGRLLLMTDPRTTSDIKDIAAHFQIEVGDNVVLDQIQMPFSAPSIGAQLYVQDFTAHPITKDLKSRNKVGFNIVSSVRAIGKTGASETWTELMKSGARSWAETDLAKLFEQEEASATFDPKADLPGPVSLAVAYEKKIAEDPAKADEKKDDATKFQKLGRVVVVGDSDWTLNVFISQFPSNRDVVLRAINWLAGQEGGVSIAKKFMRASKDPMSSEDFNYLLASSFILPELFLIFGMFIWWRRRASGA